MSKKIIYVTSILLLVLLTGCGTQTKTVYNSNNVCIVSQGKRMTIKDNTTERNYNFITKKKRKSDIKSAPSTCLDNERLKIELIPPTTIKVEDKQNKAIFTQTKTYRKRASR